MNRSINIKSRTNADLFWRKGVINGLFNWSVKIAADRRLFCFIIIFLISIQSVSIFGAEGGGVTLPILNFGVGARPMGLGGAYVALADDITSTFWNPAGLVQIHQQSISAMYTMLFLKSRYAFIGYSYPIWKRGVLALSLIYLETDSIRGINKFQEDTGDYSAGQRLFTVSYGKKMSPKINFLKYVDAGASLKLITNSVDDQTAWGVGGDLGFRYSPANVKTLRSFVFGLKLSNIIPPIMTMSEKQEWFPLEVRFGTCFRTLYDTLIINMDLEQILFRHTSPRLHVGLEYQIYRIFRARLGWDDTFNFGAGVDIDEFQVDYALSYNNDLGLGLMHQFTFTYRFGEIIP